MTHTMVNTVSSRSRFLGNRLAAVLIAAAAIGACEGDNLFSGDGPSFQPRVLNIALPETAFADDTVRVRIDAAAARQVHQILVSVRGAASVDTVIKVDQPQQQVSAVVNVPIPALLLDTLLVVEAQVTDGIGAVSAPRVAVTPAFGPPVVQSVSGSGAIRPGETANIQVSAFGARGITRLDISARGAITRDTSIAISPSQLSVSRQIALQIPDVVTDTSIAITVTAVDESGFSSPARQLALPFIIDPPIIELITPPSVQPGSPLNVQVAARAIRQISQLRLELRGAVVKDTVINIDPRRVDVLTTVAVPIPGNTTGNQIQIRGFAIDRAGSVTVTPEQTVAVPTGSPIILTIDAPASATGGHLVDVRVNATGTRPIKEIHFRWRGYLADSLAIRETRVAVNPARQNVTADVSVRVPCYKDSRALLILVTATDEADAVSAVASSTVTVSGNAECVEVNDEIEDPAPNMARPRMPGIISDAASDTPVLATAARLQPPLTAGATAAQPLMLVERTRRYRTRARRRRLPHR